MIKKRKNLDNNMARPDTLPVFPIFNDRFTNQASTLSNHPFFRFQTTPIQRPHHDRQPHPHHLRLHRRQLRPRLRTHHRRAGELSFGRQHFAVFFRHRALSFEQSDPQQKTEEPTQKKEDVALETAQTAISDESTDLNYEETAQAGLDEINTERATISYKSPRSEIGRAHV